MVSPVYDVVVVGGGPAGSATALRLCRAGLPRVLLVEAGDYESVRIGESIPPETRPLLEGLGIWDAFLRQGHDPALGSCSVWGSDRPGYNDFLVNPHGHGWHLDRRRFDALLARAAVDAGAELRLRTRCVAIRKRSSADEGWTLSLKGPGGIENVRARFVVDATGSGSGPARRLGAVRRAHDRLVYVAAFFDVAGGEPSRLTRLEAVDYGWWYAARVPDDRVVVAVASDGETVRRLGLHRPKSFRNHLARVRHLAEVVAGGRPRGGGLYIRRAPSFVLERPAGPGWAAVGDAAACYDPISSQGIHKALSDAERVAHAVVCRRSGDSRALDAFCDGVRERFAEYLDVRNYLYDLEQRWPKQPFWARRQSRRMSVAPAPPAARDEPSHVSKGAIP